MYKRKIFSLIGSLLPVEDPVQDIFDVLEKSNDALSVYSEEKAPLIEVITMLRLMDKLGFMARPCNEPIVATFLDSTEISEELIVQAIPHASFLIRRVNSALNEAK